MGGVDRRYINRAGLDCSCAVYIERRTGRARYAQNVVGLTPRPYQIEGRDFLAARRHALLADEMRVGKTPQAILAAHKAGAKTLLVVCPAIAVPQWTREIECWWPSGPLPRRAVWSYDKARAKWQDGAKGAVDVFIPDEAHFAGNPEARRTGMVYGKTGFSRMAGATWPLSGTPAPKTAASLWPMLRAFGVTDMDYADFTRRYCTFGRLSGRITGTNPYRIPELKRMLATVMLRRTRKEVAPDMPDIAFSFLNVQPVATPGYAIPAGLDDAALLDWIEAHAGANADDRQEVAMAKALPLVEEIAFAIENELLKRTVVFGWHVAPLEAVAAGLRKRGLRAACITGKTSLGERENIQTLLKHGQLDAVCANIIAAGTAIDLSAARHAYLLELDWVGGNNMQAINRLINLEMDDKVTVDVVTWPGSTDDRVQRVLLTRAQQIAKLF